MKITSLWQNTLSPKSYVGSYVLDKLGLQAKPPKPAPALVDGPWSTEVHNSVAASSLPNLQRVCKETIKSHERDVEQAKVTLAQAIETRDSAQFKMWASLAALVPVCGFLASCSVMIFTVPYVFFGIVCFPISTVIFVLAVPYVQRCYDQSCAADIEFQQAKSALAANKKSLDTARSIATSQMFENYLRTPALPPPVPPVPQTVPQTPTDITITDRFTYNGMPLVFLEPLTRPHPPPAEDDMSRASSVTPRWRRPRPENEAAKAASNAASSSPARSASVSTAPVSVQASSTTDSAHTSQNWNVPEFNDDDERSGCLLM